MEQLRGKRIFPGLAYQLLILNRSRRRAPNLRIFDRLIAGFLPSITDRPRIPMVHRG
jgi:hypothetical protein